MDKLFKGEFAPDFNGTSPDGKLIRLSAYLGRPLMLVFYRYPQCPLCNLHLSTIAHHMAKDPHINWNIIGVFPSPAWTFRKKTAQKKFPMIPIVSDPKEEIFSLYGVERDWKAILHPRVVWDFIKATFSGFIQGWPGRNLDVLPANFLINAEGEIVEAYYGQHAADHISWSVVEDFFDVPEFSPVRDAIQKKIF